MKTDKKHVIILVEEMFNLFEFWYPYYRLLEAGARGVVVAPEKGKVYRGSPATEIKADYSPQQVDAAEYDAIVIPGGYAPDKMRRHRPMVELVRKMDSLGKPVAAICHAGWMLVSARILKGRKATSFYAIKDDMLNAGAIWEDRNVVVDKNLITSRTPDDLPAFMKALLAALDMR